MQRRGKHTSITTEELLGNCVLRGSSPKLYNEDLRQIESEPRVEAGSNTLTVDLRVVGGDGEVRSRTHSGNACYHSVSNLLYAQKKIMPV
jgi:hypothetical protein